MIMNRNKILFNYKVLRQCQRFVSTENQAQNIKKWETPKGYDTGIKIYNPITKSKEPLVIENPNFVKWYMCGPTVYDSAHLGHATTYVKSDIIRRILSNYFNIDVVLVMCITDIDDKIIKQAKATDQSIQKLTMFYENEFFDDMNALNVQKPHLTCRVTDYVPQIIKFIEKICDNNGAYKTKNGSVYFDTKKHSKYGKLCVPFEDNPHPEKKSTLDFALWKTAKDGEPFWESPWGPGRPGWHIECSTIASTIFGNSVDIHSGGIDLVFPHHENEEAQSCSHHGVNQWVNYWLHCGHLFLKGDVKMSKSLKNTISIQEFLKNHTANQFRMLCMLTNYRNGIEFSDEVMQNAVSTLSKIENFLVDCNNYVAGRIQSKDINELYLLQHLNETKDIVHVSLMDNFNTAQALSAIVKLVGIGNKMIHENAETSTSRSIVAISAVSNYISTILAKLGISNTKPTESNQRLENVINHFVNFRSAVKNRVLQKDVKDKSLLAMCDEARTNLSHCGIKIKDQKNSSTWSIENL